MPHRYNQYSEQLVLFTSMSFQLFHPQPLTIHHPPSIYSKAYDMSLCSRCNDDDDDDGDDDNDNDDDDDDDDDDDSEATTIGSDDSNDSDDNGRDMDRDGDDDSRLDDHIVRRHNESSINQIDQYALHRRVELLQWLLSIGHGLNDAPIHLSSLLCKSSLVSIHAKSSKATTICSERYKSSSHQEKRYDDDDDDDDKHHDHEDYNSNNNSSNIDLISIVPCIAGTVRLYGVLQSLMKMHPLFDNGNDI